RGLSLLSRRALTHRLPKRLTRSDRSHLPQHCHTLFELQVADEARVLVLLRGAAGLRQAVRVPIRPRARGDDRCPQRAEPAALTLRRVLHVLDTQLSIKLREEAR